MSNINTVKELPSVEQTRMAVEDAGKMYSGYFIFFTNSEDKLEDGRWKEYGIPRVIALNNKIFCESGLSEKYRDRTLYGVPFSCSAFMAEDQIPPILTF